MTESNGGHTYDKLWCNSLAHAYKKIRIISQQRPHTFLCSLINITTYRQPILHLHFGHSRTLKSSHPCLLIPNHWFPSSDSKTTQNLSGCGRPFIVKKRPTPGTSSVTLFILMTISHNQNNIQQADKDQLGENTASLTVGKCLKIDTWRAK